MCKPHERAGAVAGDLAVDDGEGGGALSIENVRGHLRVAAVIHAAVRDAHITAGVGDDGILRAVINIAAGDEHVL